MSLPSSIRASRASLISSAVVTNCPSNIEFSISPPRRSLSSPRRTGLLRHAFSEYRDCTVVVRFLEKSAHRRPRDSVLLRDLRERHAGAAVEQDLLAVDVQP